MKEGKIKSDLIELFKLCCEKRPHDMKNYAYDFNALENYVANSISTISNSRSYSFNALIKNEMNNASLLMPKVKYCFYDDEAEYPFSLYQLNTNFFTIGFEFSDKPPICIFTKQLRNTIRLRYTLLRKKKLFSRENRMLDFENFKNVISQIKSKFDNSEYEIEVDDDNIIISSKLHFLCFGELFSEISVEEYKEFFKIKEESKIKVSEEKLSERIREMKRQ